MDRPGRLPLRWAWRGALAVFVLAGATGAFFRFAVAHGMAFGLDLGNVRHAHSHLMYFGWATPALFALIARRLPELGGRPVSRVRAVLVAAFGLALLAFPPFLLYGYTSVAVGAARLPLGAMAAGLNVLAWYAFAGAYVRARRGAPPTLALRLFDVALGFLVLATLGAWGLPALQIAGIESAAVKSASLHLFLDAFSEGWFVFGVLGLVAAETTAEKGRLAAWGAGLAAAGVPFTFALGMPAALVPSGLAVVARTGGALVGGGLLLVVASLSVESWRLQKRGTRKRGPKPSGLWRLALGLLAAKALGQLAVSAAPGLGWGSVPAFRILYLHLMLLGFVTLGLVAAARAVWGIGATRGHRLFATAVALLLVSLLATTPLWPAAWGGRWVADAVAWCALGPVLAAAWMVARPGVLRWNGRGAGPR